MKNRFLLAGIIAGTLLASGAATADGVYKWTDAEGNVHYEDRPSGADSTERLALSYKRTDQGAVAGRKESLAETRAARDKARATQAEEQQAAEQKMVEEEARQQKCESYRAKLETFVTSRRLYRKDDNGERVFLEEDEIQKTRARAEELVAKYCTN